MKIEHIIKDDKWRQCGLKRKWKEDFLKFDYRQKQVFSIDTYRTYPFQNITWQVCQNCLKAVGE